MVFTEPAIFSWSRPIEETLRTRKRNVLAYVDLQNKKTLPTMLNYHSQGPDNTTCQYGAMAL